MRLDRVNNGPYATRKSSLILWPMKSSMGVIDTGSTPVQLQDRCFGGLDGYQQGEINVQVLQFRNVYTLP